MEVKRNVLLQNMGYSQKAVNILESNLNIGVIKSPTVSISAQSDCGDFLLLYLSIHKNIITNAKYQCIGCAGVQAVASAVTEMIKGKSVDDALLLRPSDIIKYLEKVPESKIECVRFVNHTLRKALEKYLSA